MEAALLAVFGVVGVFSRVALQWTSGRWLGASHAAWTTLVINVLGSAAIGIVYVWGFEKNGLSPELRLALMAGFLGGFTTFSSFSLDCIHFLSQGRWSQAALYFLLSPTLGVLSAGIAIQAARRFCS